MVAKNDLGILYLQCFVVILTGNITLINVFHAISCSSCLLIRKRRIITLNDRIIPLKGE